jgi:hypothetical protein
MCSVWINWESEIKVRKNEEKLYLPKKYLMLFHKWKRNKLIYFQSSVSMKAASVERKPSYSNCWNPNVKRKT